MIPHNLGHEVRTNQSLSILTLLRLVSVSMGQAIPPLNNIRINKHNYGMDSFILFSRWGVVPRESRPVSSRNIRRGRRKWISSCLNMPQTVLE